MVNKLYLSIYLSTCFYLSKNRDLWEGPTPEVRDSRTSRTLRMLMVKSDKSDWLRIWNDYSVHVPKDLPRVSRFLVLTKRNVASGDENTLKHDRSGLNLRWSKKTNHSASFLMGIYINKELKRCTTAMAITTPPSKRFKEKSNGSALVLYIFVQFIAVLCAWLSSACFQEHERERLSFRIFIWNWMLALHI